MAFRQPFMRPKRSTLTALRVLQTRLGQLWLNPYYPIHLQTQVWREARAMRPPVFVE